MITGTIIFFISKCIDCSYYLFTIFGIVCIILSVSGIKKTGKYATVSVVIYFLLQCVKAAIK